MRCAIGFATGLIAQNTRLSKTAKLLRMQKKPRVPCGRACDLETSLAMYPGLAACWLQSRSCSSSSWWSNHGVFCKAGLGNIFEQHLAGIVITQRRTDQTFTSPLHGAAAFSVTSGLPSHWISSRSSWYLTQHRNRISLPRWGL